MAGTSKCTASGNDSSCWRECRIRGSPASKMAWTIYFVWQTGMVLYAFWETDRVTDGHWLCYVASVLERHQVKHARALTVAAVMFSLVLWPVSIATQFLIWLAPDLFDRVQEYLERKLDELEDAVHQRERSKGARASG